MLFDGQAVPLEMSRGKHGLHVLFDEVPAAFASNSCGLPEGGGAPAAELRSSPG